MRHKLAAPVALLFLLSLSAGIRPAAASCGSEICPVDHASRWDEARLAFDLTQQYIDQDQPRAGTEDVAVGAIPAHHDEVRTVNRLTTARASYRPSPGWTASIALPWIDRTHEHIHHHQGEAIYQRWNYSGVGDLEAVVIRRLGGAAEGQARYFVSAGAKAPTGVRNVEEVDGDQPEPSARPGTGSWDVLVGAGAEWHLGLSTFAAHGGMPLRASVNGRWNGRGTERYQVGSEVTGHVGVEAPFFSWGSLLLQTNARVRAKDEVGDASAEEANTGGTTVYLSPGVRVGRGGTHLVGLVQIPVYQRVNGIQVVSGTNLFVGVTHALLP